jgi:hypothetical protein
MQSAGLGDRGAQAIARVGARCASHVHGRGARTNACGFSLYRGIVDAGFNSWFAPAACSAKNDACGRSFAVLST